MSSPPELADPTAQPIWRPRAGPWKTAASVVLATFMEVLDTTVVVVSLPYIAGSMAATNEEATWVLTTYLVANGIILPASGWLARRFGRKRLLMLCTALFTLSSLFCGLAPSLTFLLLARLTQGAGGGAMQPLAQAILLESFPPAKRGMAMAAYALIIVLAPTIGPSLGGWLTDHYSWRWAFYINLPVGTLALVLMARFLEDPPYIRSARPGRIDGLGFALLTLWIGTLQVILDKGQQVDWFAAVWIRWFAGISVSSMFAYILHEFRTAEPLTDFRAFRDRNFAVGTVVIAIFSAILYSSVTMLPLFLQTLLGYTAAHSGLAIAPRGLGSLLGLPIVGRLVAVVDGRWLVVVGISLLGISNYMLGHLNLEVGMGDIVLPNFIMGLGMSCIFVPLATLAMAKIPVEKMGNATSIYNLVRNIAGSIGVSATTTYLIRSAQRDQALMVAHLTPYDPAYQRYLAALHNSLTPLVGSPRARQAAYGVLYNLLLQQAHLRSYVDTFRWMAVVILLCIPSVMLMKKVVYRRSGPAH